MRPTYLMVVRMAANHSECVVDWVMIDVNLGDGLRRAACHPALVDIIVQHHRRTRRHNRVLTSNNKCYDGHCSHNVRYYCTMSHNIQ